MHVEIIPKKISSNDKSGFPAFPPKKKLGSKNANWDIGENVEKTPNLGKIGIPRENYKVNITLIILKCHYMCRYK